VLLALCRTAATGELIRLNPSDDLRLRPCDESDTATMRELIVRLLACPHYNSEVGHLALLTLLRRNY
jgi:hypothetical protein